MQETLTLTREAVERALIEYLSDRNINVGKIEINSDGSAVVEFWGTLDESN